MRQASGEKAHFFFSFLGGGREERGLIFLVCVFGRGGTSELNASSLNIH